MKKSSLKQFIKLTFILIFLLGSVSTTLSQTMVSGVVKDSNGDAPLPFAPVAVKGTTNGTTTDMNGE